MKKERLYHYKVEGVAEIKKEGEFSTRIGDIVSFYIRAKNIKDAYRKGKNQVKEILGENSRVAISTATMNETAIETEN